MAYVYHTNGNPVGRLKTQNEVLMSFKQACVSSILLIHKLSQHFLVRRSFPIMTSNVNFTTFLLRVQKM